MTSTLARDAFARAQWVRINAFYHLFFLMPKKYSVGKWMAGNSTSLEVRETKTNENIRSNQETEQDENDCCEKNEIESTAL